MPHALTTQNCAWCPNTELPRTLVDLRQVTTVTDLGYDLETLALIGTQFESALFTTQNAGALLSDQGGYGPLQTNNMPFRICRRRVSLRISCASPLRIARSAKDPDARLAGSLIAVDDQGAVHHRVQYNTPADQLVADSLSPQVVIDFPVDDALRHHNVVPFTAIRQARKSWDTEDAGRHLNDMLRDGGQQRQACLPHIGRERAWRVALDIIPSFLCFLCDQGFDFTRMVTAPGMIHASTGRVDTYQTIKSIFLARAKQSVFSLDCSQISEAWVIASGTYWQLEFFDAKQTGLAVFAADPMADATDWRDYLASLPRAA